MIANIIRALEIRYGCCLERLTGGYTNITYLMTGTEPQLVAKVSNLSNEDTLNEINVMKLLQGSCDTPVVHDVSLLEGMRVIVMDCMRGVNAQSVLDAGDWTRADWIYRNMGQLLAAQIHSRPYVQQASGIRVSNRPGLAPMIRKLEFVPESLGRQSVQLLSAAGDPEQPWVLTHGDYGVHNLLYEPESALHVLDWEWAEWGNPLNDVAWVCWFTKLHYPVRAAELNAAFMEGYLSVHPLSFSPQQLKAASLYKVWNVLHRLRIAPKEVQREWVRRLEWTLHEDFTELHGVM
ncbi:aminoglycoside phosphotransferase family protein [Paenibacillus sp. MMS20-IR301]|uniref:phosphotransferase family protein n=1 Tax=Paenibacillus sp. MMS20-IR301 TaxID=2895946 RepID=UPI0028EF7FCF|nr:aminoglycoside phosphotransferase family protein [Paenibacillus sp. MMS20-IR301]WNS42384.1 aminoglycoside phosphotransferase family protein [Paenibacillus sp. MMS20-IR301]